MWTAANFIIEGGIRPQVVHLCSKSKVMTSELGLLQNFRGYKK